MKRTGYPISAKFGPLEVWHYGDGCLQVYPMNQRWKGCETGTGTIKPDQVRRLRDFLVLMLDGNPARKKGGKK